MLFLGISCELIDSSASPGTIDWEDGSTLVPAEDQHLDGEVRSRYLEDAEKLAVRHIHGIDSTQTEIPQPLIDLLYHGLIHIVNADHPKAIEATQEFEIHARMPVDPREIIVHADTTASWIDAWRNASTETGNPEIDALLQEFDFSLVDYSELAHVLPTGMATLRSDYAINGYAVGRLFKEVQDIENAGPDGVTDGSDISVLFFEDRLQFTFEYGFGDCPAGCINRHIWKFTVNQQGNVEFVEEDGDALPAG